MFRSFARLFLASLAIGCVAEGCSGGSGGSGTGGVSGATGGKSGTGGAGQTGGASGDPTVLAGTFTVKLVAPTTDGTMSGTLTVTGKVSNGPTPPLNSWEDALAEGACHLLKPKVPFCATPCGSNAVCVDTNTCQDYAVAKNLGDVTMQGLTGCTGTPPIKLFAVKNNYQLPAEVTCPFSAVAEGSTVSLTTSGADYPSFSLSAKGIAPLVLTNTTLPVNAGQALPLTWTPPANPSASSIHVKLDISHHGGTRGMISCDTADNGSLTLSANMISQLLALGVAGFPTVVVTRTATGAAQIAPGRVDMVVSSEVETSVQVQGIVSCTSDEPCIPLGKTCATDLRCQ